MFTVVRVKYVTALHRRQLLCVGPSAAALWLVNDAHRTEVRRGVEGVARLVSVRPLLATTPLVL